jgi:hypothetical protein
VRRFLKACGLPIYETNRALARARDIAAEVGTAVMRIDLGRSETSIEVNGPNPARDERMLASSHNAT